MYGDRTMKRIMGVNEEQIPEEMYQYWNSRIGEQYRSYVAKSVERIVTSGGPAQLEYTWVHPELGGVWYNVLVSEWEKSEIRSA